MVLIDTSISDCPTRFKQVSVNLPQVSWKLEISNAFAATGTSPGSSRPRALLEERVSQNIAR